MASKEDIRAKRSDPANLSDNQQESPNSSPEADTKTLPENSSSGINPGMSKHSQDTDVKRESHDESHTFLYNYRGKQYTVLCHSHGTVLDALGTSDAFKNLVNTNLHKEVVIQRGTLPKAAVCTHFPCHLIDNKEELKILFIQGNSSAAKPRNKDQRPATELITFCVELRGGKNIIAKVIENPKLRDIVRYCCVYAYKNEKVKDALRRDGRFHNHIFETHCALSEIMNEGANTELSQLVDGCDGKIYHVKRISNVSVPDSQEDCDNTPTEEQREPPGEQPEAGPSAQSSTPPETGNARSQRKEVEKDGGGLLVKQTRLEISNSKEILLKLRSQFTGLVEKLKERAKLKNKSDVQQFFRKEFGKKTQCFQEVKTIQCLIERSASVCQVRIEGKARGTGFLLFDKFILTNGHVVEDIYEEINNRLLKSVAVTFDFYDLTRSNERRVKPGVIYEKKMDKMGRYFDFALLELSPDDDTGLPAGLLSKFNFPTSEGGVCLIGHPDGGVKKIDLCFVTPNEFRKETILNKTNENPEWMEYMQMINNNYFINLDEEFSLVRNYTSNVVTYDTCFFHGSSGSPVFNENCEVVAMHTGGYDYKDKKGKTQSVIEYAIPLSSILENLLIQAVKRKRVDVLKGFLFHGKQNEKLAVQLNKVEERPNNHGLRQAFMEFLGSNSNTSKQEEPMTF